MYPNIIRFFVYFDVVPRCFLKKGKAEKRYDFQREEIQNKNIYFIIRCRRLCEKDVAWKGSISVIVEKISSK